MIKSATQSSIATTQKYRNMNGSYVASSDYKLDEVAITTPVNSITFDVSAYASQGYKNLQIRAFTRASTTSPVTALLRFNSDSGSNYSRHYFIGDGSSVSTGGSSSGSYTYAFELPNASASSGNYTSAVIDILDSFSSTKNKVTRSFFGYAPGGVGMESGAWLSTAPVTSITIYCTYSAEFAAGSIFSLYGGV